MGRIGILACSNFITAAALLVAGPAWSEEKSPIFHLLPVSAVAAAAQTSDLVASGTYKPFVGGVSYFSIDISKMHLPYSKTFWKSYYPAARVIVGFQAPQQKVEFHGVTPASKFLNLTEDEPERIAVFNTRVLAPAAYVDGRLDIDLALVGLESSDIGKQYLATLAEASSLFGSSFLSKSLPVLTTLKSGIEKFLGLEEVKFEAGAKDSLGSPTAGLWALIWPSGKVIDRAKLTVVSEGSGHLALRHDNQPLTGVSWALVRIGVVEQHPHWRDIPGLLAAQQDVFETFLKKGEKKAKEKLEDFKLLVMTKFDLHVKHRLSIYRSTQNQLTSLAAEVVKVLDPLTTDAGTNTTGSISNAVSVGEITAENLPFYKQQIGEAKWLQLAQSSVKTANARLHW